MSLSSWRAWIEIGNSREFCSNIDGRSPHGERGLKCKAIVDQYQLALSLSSWRAWIEIPIACMAAGEIWVALLMESVD